MSEREIGELIASVHALENQITRLERKMEKIVENQAEMGRKMSGGRGFIVGLMMASGTAGASVAGLFNKMFSN